jgi:hypothetical protein
LSDILVRERLTTSEDTTPQEDDSQGPGTQDLLNDLALESRGFQDFFRTPEDIFELDSTETDPIS